MYCTHRLSVYKIKNISSLICRDYRDHCTTSKSRAARVSEDSLVVIKCPCSKPIVMFLAIYCTMLCEDVSSIVEQFPVHSTMMCGADRRTAIVVITVNVVKVIRQNLSRTNSNTVSYSLKEMFSNFE